MKLRTFCCSAVLFCIAHTLAFAQSITLDSLWGKFVGNINAMVFTPDSKSILIGNDEKQLVRYNALTGDTISIIPTLYGAQECIFTKEGNKLFIRGFKGIEIKDASTFQTLDSLPVPTKEHDFASFDINNDGSVIAVKSHVWDSKEVFYWEIAVYNNSTKQTVWSVKTKGALGTNSRYPEGKIALTPDGNYVLGQNSFFLCKWNWRDSIQPGEILIENIPNLELISFSPDRNYFVLKGRQIWSLSSKSQLKLQDSVVPNELEYCFFSRDSKLLFWNDNWRLKVVNLKELKNKAIDSNISGKIILSPDEKLLSYASYRYTMVTKKLFGEISSIIQNMDEVQISLYPNPSQGSISIELSGIPYILNANIYITDVTGNKIKDVFNGFMSDQNNSYTLSTTDLPSGKYIFILQLHTKTFSKPFIITK